MRTWVILAAVVFFASLLGAAVGTALVLIYAPWLAWYGLLPSRWYPLAFAAIAVAAIVAC
jgi:hypothetical protein